jgi:ABC-2 type transport system ATP-binding protein/ribosome-dependent ATPase
VAYLAESRATTKCFGNVTAVDDVDLAVGSGEVVGLLGANGAGKTTLIRMLLGLLTPTRGTVSLFGSSPSRATRRRVGYVPQTLGLYDDLTVQENWEFTGAAFGTEGQNLPPDLTGSGRELVGDLSLGLQRRVAFAVAFSHDPDLLILDEPTSGVGPLSSSRLWEDVRSSAEDGTGVLVTTHNMEEAAQCDRLVVMVGGRVVASGTLIEVIGPRQVAQVVCDDWRKAFAALDADGLVVQVQGGHLRVPGTADQVEALLRHHQLVGDVTAVPANLEEAFVDIVTSVLQQ